MLRNGRRARLSPRGYSLVMVACLTAAATLLAFAAIALGGAESEQARLEAQDALALSLAERGVERTKAYLAAILESDVDLDRALDPALDDTCAAGTPFAVADPAGDDHLPRFTDPGASAVTLAGWGASKKARFLRVPYPDASAPQGAYLVRIDDDDDDQGFGFPRAQESNPMGTSCQEGGNLSAPDSNPVRDRDRTVVVTAVGIAPGVDPDRARARKVLRVVVGKREMPGLLAGGAVSVTGSAELCGPFAHAQATGPMDVRKMCAAGCGGACATPAALLARTSDSACSRADGGPCIAGADPPPTIPPVDPGARQWRPRACYVSPCTPYYLLTPREAPAGLKLKMWDYSTCPDPRACATDPMLCACWRDVTANTVGADKVYLDDADPGLESSLPSPAGHLGDAGFVVFRHVSGTGALTCTAGSAVPVSNAVIRYDPAPIHAPPLPDVLPPLPHGVWLIDGLLQMEAAADMPVCPAGWGGASLVVRGSVVLHNRDYWLRPPPSLDAILVVGGDLEFQTGNTGLSNCGTGAAVAVREQARAQGNNELAAPLLVAHQPTCFNDVASATAVDFGGNLKLKVDVVPLLSIEPLTTLSWSESAH